MKHSSVLSTGIFLMLALFFSCVPAKKQTYLQSLNGFSYEIPDEKSPAAFSEKVPEYKLQSGDIIRVNVTSITPVEFNFFSEATSADARLNPLLTGYMVDRDGNIVLPFIGAFMVKGLTVIEAQNKITEVLKEYLESPTVDMRLVSFDYTVMGEVIRQGKFNILENQINVLEAIGSAGGLTQFANYEDVKILRSDDGVSTVGHVNLLQDNLPTSPYFYLKPNDVVIVDPLKNKNFRSNSSVNIALILSALGTAITVILAVDNLSTR